MEDVTLVWNSSTRVPDFLAFYAEAIPVLNPIYKYIYITIGIAGIFGNSLALVVLLGHKPLRRKPSNYFLINQCFIDLMVSVFLIPTTVVDPTLLKGRAACYAWKSRVIFLVLFLAAVYNITALTVERYVKIVHPFRHRIWVTKRRLKWAIVVSTVAGISLKTPYAVGGVMYLEGDVCPFQAYPTATLNTLAGFYNFSVEFILPLTVIAFCYTQMARSLRKNPQVIIAVGSVHSDAPTMTRARKNILKILFYVVLVFVVCTSWKHAMILIKSVTGIRYELMGPKFNIGQILSYSVCAIDPFIYIFQYEEFQIGLRKMLLARKSKYASETPSSDETVKSGSAERF